MVILNWWMEVRGGVGPRCKTGPSFETIVNFSGTKIDLREDKPTLQALSENNQSPVKREAGQRLSNKIRAVKYLECSALTQRGLKQVSRKKIESVIQI